jgi:hypothetical protein
MIESVERIEIVKAIDLPPVFGILVGIESIYFEVEEVDETHIYFRELESGDVVNAPHDLEMSILVPDSWNDPATQVAISIGLLEQGIIEI